MQSKDLGQPEQAEPGPVDKYGEHRDRSGRFTAGNPGGGRKHCKVSILAEVKRILRKEPWKAEQIANNLVDKAMKGDDHRVMLWFIKEVIDRIDGPVQRNMTVNLPVVDEGITLAERPRVGDHDADRN